MFLFGILEDYLVKNESICVNTPEKQSLLLFHTLTFPCLVCSWKIQLRRFTFCTRLQRTIFIFSTTIFIFSTTLVVTNDSIHLLNHLVILSSHSNCLVPFFDPSVAVGGYPVSIVIHSPKQDDCNHFFVSFAPWREQSNSSERAQVANHLENNLPPLPPERVHRLQVE